MIELTQKRLKECLHYSKETGIFIWKIKRKKVFVDSQAGTKIKKGKDRYCLQIQIDGRKYQAHRLAWLYVYGVWPNGQVDHRNLDSMCNIFENLRDSTPSQNSINRRGRIRDLPKGVEKQRRKYRANICINGKKIHSKLYKTPEEASIKYCEMAKALHGEFARFS